MRRLTGLPALTVASIALIAGAQTPDSVYTLNNGIVAVEPENRPFNSSAWKKRTSPSGFRGSGWLLVEQGGTTGGGPCHNVATLESCMPAENTWLEIPVYLPQPQGDHGAIFGMDVRAYRDSDGDGSNDVWVGIKGVTAASPTETGYAFRIGCSVKGYHFCWGAITPQQLPNQGGWAYWSLRDPGIYTFFVAGRSKGFGVDRIVVYQVPKEGTGPGLTDLVWPDAWNTSIPASQLQSYSDVVGVHATAGRLTVSQSVVTARLLPSAMLRLEGIEPGDRMVLSTLHGRTVVSGPAAGAMQLPERLTSGTFLFTLYRRGTRLATQRLSPKY